MPRFGHGSLTVGLEAIQLHDICSDVLEQSGSEHAGRWAGDMLSFRVMWKDTSNMAGTSGSTPIITWNPSNTNWGFHCLGSIIWWNVTAGVGRAGATFDVGTAGELDSILDGVVADAHLSTGAFIFGEATADYKGTFQVNGGKVITATEAAIWLSWSALSLTTSEGSLWAMVWGYPALDVNDSTA